MNLTVAKIIRLRLDFKDKFGIEPNIVLVAPNAEMDLNAQRIKVGQQFLRMKVLICDTIEDIAVGVINNEP